MTQRKSSGLNLEALGTILMIGLLGVVLAGILIKVEKRIVQIAFLSVAGGITVLLVLTGVALVVRANKHSNTQQREIWRERHTVERDGRAPEPAQVHLLESRKGEPTVYPALLKAYYAAGADAASLPAPSSDSNYAQWLATTEWETVGEPGDPDVVEGEARELPPGKIWDGKITK